MASASDPLGLIGTIIAEKYAVESVVGEGGFAVVYRATHVLWKRPVAVKVFKALGEVAKTERQKLLDDFIQEGALLAELSERSPAICQARDVGMLTAPGGDQVPYMVLEWLEGMPLDAVLEKERASNAPLRSLEETIRLLDAVAEALALAHKKGIAHRDVKPANVFVLGDPRGQDLSVKLLDFGIAKVVQDAQKMGFGKTAGHITSFTPSYGAPEQFNRAYGATGPWTDVFALALVVSEVLSGAEPLPGDTLVQLAYASSDPSRRPTPGTFGIRLSDAVEAVFMKAVAVKPEDRFQMAGDFWNALRTAAIGQPLSSLGSARDVTASVRGGDIGVAATAVAPSGAITAPAPGAAFGPPSVAVPPSAPPRKTRSLAPIIIAVVGVVATAVGLTVVFTSGRASKERGIERAAVSMVAPSESVSAAIAGEPSCPAGMKPIPGGMYFMGSAESDAVSDEKPAHNVKVAAYCLDEFEVTVAQYKSCSDVGTCLRASKKNYFRGISPAQAKLYDPLCNENDTIGRANHPINCVSWEQARKFCDSRGARLPTEAEWEFAARTSDGRIYPWGDDPPSAKLLNACGKECVAWMKKHPDPDQPIESMYDEDDGYPATAPVGSFPKGKSRWGIQDIAGNVWEWVGDWYADYDPASAATVSVDPKGPPNGTERVIRGGAWNGAKPAWVRPAWRFRSDPTFQTHGVGFRCAKSL